MFASRLGATVAPLEEWFVNHQPQLGTQGLLHGLGALHTLLDAGRHKEALTAFETVQSDEAFRARAWQGMGQALLAMGNTTAAISQLNSALEADPSLWRSWAA